MTSGLSSTLTAFNVGLTWPVNALRKQQDNSNKKCRYKSQQTAMQGGSTFHVTAAWPGSVRACATS